MKTIFVAWIPGLLAVALGAGCAGGPAGPEALTTTAGEAQVTSRRNEAGDVQTVLAANGVERVRLTWAAETGDLVWRTDLGPSLTSHRSGAFSLEQMNAMAQSLWTREAGVVARARSSGSGAEGSRALSEYNPCDGVSFSDDSCAQSCGWTDGPVTTVGDAEICYAGCMVDLLSAAISACAAQ